MSLTLVGAGRPTWACVDTDLYVVSRAGEYLGSVDRANDGSFLAFDGRATPVGRYSSLSEAQEAVLSVPEAGAEEKQRRTERAWQSVAAVSGVVAGVCALTAGAVVPFL